MAHIVINTPDELRLIELLHEDASDGMHRFVLREDASGGLYQFAQRAVQEYLAAYPTLHVSQVECRVNDKESIVRALVAEVLVRIKTHESESRHMPSLFECVAAMHNILYFTIVLPRNKYTEGVKAIVVIVPCIARRE